MAQVNKDMTIAEVLQISEETAPIFLQFGMHCLGCPVSKGESVKDAAAAHGVNADELIKTLNDFLKDK